MSLWFHYNYLRFENILFNETWIFDVSVDNSTSFYFVFNDISGDTKKIEVLIKKKIDMDIDDLDSKFYTSKVHFIHVRQPNGLYRFRVEVKFNKETNKFFLEYS